MLLKAKINNFFKFKIQKNSLVKSLLASVFITAVGLGFFGAYSYRLEFESRLYSAQQDKLFLTEQNQNFVSDIKDLNSLVEQKDSAIKNRDKTIESKNTEIKKLKNQIADLKASLAQTTIEPPAIIAPATTIYDRIQVTGSFKQQLIRAVDLLRTKDPANYQILNGQVNNIYAIDVCGGLQIKRDIYIGSCSGAFGDPEVASVIIHEAMHVYNVYVNGVYSSGTAEQELPSLYAELNSANKIGTAKWYVDQTKADIEYWESQ